MRAGVELVELATRSVNKLVDGVVADANIIFSNSAKFNRYGNIDNNDNNNESANVLVFKILLLLINSFIMMTIRGYN